VGKDITPRVYQLNARDQVIYSYEHDNKNVFLILLPTGMGKTLISTIIIEMLLERELVAKDEKILFLVQDRKLKHQLYDMAKEYGLADYGYLSLLDNQKGIPKRMSRKHTALAKFLFATPILLMNAVTGKTKRVDKSTLAKVKVVVIDEILDIFAQSYGGKKPREETIAYIENRFGFGRTFEEIIRDLKRELESSGSIDYEIDERRLEEQVLREFSSRKYRLNKKFEPILHFLDLLNHQNNRIVIGMTASLSQDTKIDLLKRTFGGEDAVAEIRPVGDDFEDYKPAYQLGRIKVFDDWISMIDSLISKIKGSLMSKLNQVYRMLTGKSKIPPDRILLFITDLITKKELQKKLLARLRSDSRKLSFFIGAARAYLLVTVARQRLLESTFPSFTKFINNVTNGTLLANSDFQTIKQEVLERATQNIPDEKEKRLLYWLHRFVNESKSVLVMCRFVEMTKHLTTLAMQNGIPSTYVHGKMDGSMQHTRIRTFKSGEAKVLFASERLIEKGTDLPEADVGIYYGTTVSLERYEQSLGRIRSNVRQIKTFYTISYNQTTEDEKALKRETMFLELIGKQLGALSKDEIIELDE
jgi:superfamily II DNA or RNA helicase